MGSHLSAPQPGHSAPLGRGRGTSTGRRGTSRPERRGQSHISSGSYEARRTNRQSTISSTSSTSRDPLDGADLPRYVRLTNAKVPPEVLHCTHNLRDLSDECACAAWINGRIYRVQCGIDDTDDPYYVHLLAHTMADPQFLERPSEGVVCRCGVPSCPDTQWWLASRQTDEHEHDWPRTLSTAGKSPAATLPPLRRPWDYAGRQ